MPTIELSYPALLFPAMSVLVLAYTNRFAAISNRVRNLHAQHEENPHEDLRSQIKTMHRRLVLIRWMQMLAAGGFICCLLSMALMLLCGSLVLLKAASFIAFVAAIVLLAVALTISLFEIRLSVHAVEIQLSDLED